MQQQPAELIQQNLASESNDDDHKIYDVDYDEQNSDSSISVASSIESGSRNKNLNISIDDENEEIWLVTLTRARKPSYEHHDMTEKLLRDKPCNKNIAQHLIMTQDEVPFSD